VAIVGILATVAALMAVSPSRGSQPETEIVIVAKGMTFKVVGASGAEQANPTLRFPAGASITVIFRNEDPGMRHDLVFEALGVRSRVLAYGEQQRITLTIPDEAGAYVYLCSLHPQTMRGRLVIYATPRAQPLQQ
jgi:plastocyanin